VRRHSRVGRYQARTVDGPDVPDLGQNREGFDTVAGCEYAAHLVFCEISERHGEAEARRIFAEYMEPSDERKAELKNKWLLWVVDIMRSDKLHADGSKTPGLGIQEIARQLAEHNKTLPREEQRGPGGTDPFNLVRHIHLQLEKRDMLATEPASMSLAELESTTKRVTARLVDVVKSARATPGKPKRKASPTKR
jgi:hypothetical protein